MEISATGALLGLTIAIFLIMLRVVPAYALIFGAFLGGLFGGADPAMTIGLMIGGAKDIVPATMRIITAGVLAGVLVESGAAIRIAETIIRAIGERRALAAIAVATMLLTAVGVFIDVAVITVAPIALAVGEKTGVSRFALLLAMIGGGKAGNVISPNPNTIAAAVEFQLELSKLMLANVVPALCGLVASILTAAMLNRHGTPPVSPALSNENAEAASLASTHEMPGSSSQKQGVRPVSFAAAILGPLVTILLLMLKPASALFGINVYEIDPLIALPVGGIVGCLAMGKGRNLGAYMSAGLGRMTGVAVLLLGTGTLAGIIKGSALKHGLVEMLEYTGMPGFMLAPISGIVMAAATASTTAGTTVASQTFHEPLLTMGIAPLGAAAMIHAGATVLDHLPHGSFFHATGGAVGMSTGERMKMIPFETAVGLVLVVVATLLYGIF